MVKNNSWATVRPLSTWSYCHNPTIHIRMGVYMSGSYLVIVVDCSVVVDAIMVAAVAYMASVQ